MTCICAVLFLFYTNKERWNAAFKKRRILEYAKARNIYVTSGQKSGLRYLKEFKDIQFLLSK